MTPPAMSPRWIAYGTRPSKNVWTSCAVIACSAAATCTATAGACAAAGATGFGTGRGGDVCPIAGAAPPAPIVISRASVVAFNRVNMSPPHYVLLARCARGSGARTARHDSANMRERTRAVSVFGKSDVPGNGHHLPSCAPCQCLREGEEPVLPWIDQCCSSILRRHGNDARAPDRSEIPAHRDAHQAWGDDRRVVFQHARDRIGRTGYRHIVLERTGLHDATLVGQVLDVDADIPVVAIDAGAQVDRVVTGDGRTRRESRQHARDRVAERVIGRALADVPEAGPDIAIPAIAQREVVIAIEANTGFGRVRQGIALLAIGRRRCIFGQLGVVV